MTGVRMHKWPIEDLDKLNLDDTEISEEQVAWMLYKLTTFIEQGGGTFRTLADHMGSDYSTMYSLGGMNFTNAIAEAMSTDYGEEGVKET